MDVGTSGLNAVAAVAAHHAELDPKCAALYQSRWVEALKITTYRQRAAGCVARRQAGA